MRRCIFPALVAVLLVPGGSGWCQDSEGPLRSPLPPPVQDPSLSTSRYFPPSLTHAGVADTGPALGYVRIRSGAAGCSAASPCAMPSPALDHAVAAHTG